MHITGNAPKHVALYCRVSSEDQAERGTIEAQRTLLLDLAGVYQWDVSCVYKDDGVSGTIPLADRPEGRRLLADGRSGLFTEVVVFRIDRLARSLSVLLDAHRTLEQLGIAIRSATEPFDTSTSVGKLLFQLLGSFAEFERNSMQERLTLGRDRVAKAGKWTGGPIPFGYDLDDQGRLVLSQRIVAVLDQTEAEVARAIFERVANGSTLVLEAQRLNALGILSARRWSSGAQKHGSTWTAARLSKMLASRLYVGVSVLKSRNQTIQRPAPALIDEKLWIQARTRLDMNRTYKVRRNDQMYPPRFDQLRAVWVDLRWWRDRAWSTRQVKE